MSGCLPCFASGLLTAFRKRFKLSSRVIPELVSGPGLAHHRISPSPRRQLTTTGNSGSPESASCDFISPQAASGLSDILPAPREYPLGNLDSKTFHSSVAASALSESVASGKNVLIRGPVKRIVPP